MTIRNLNYVLSPKSLAVLGASDREGSLGRVVMSNILSAGFSGPVWPVNPKYDEVAGLQCFRRVEDIDGVPDLAVIVTPAARVPGIIDELGRKGTRAAVVITAGLTDGNGLRQAMLDAAKPFLFRIVGPNTVGLNIPPIGLNASFAHLSGVPGSVALLSQSGAIMTSLLDWAADNNVGFSHVVSLGDMVDADAADFLDLLANDPGTKAIVMYLESIPNPRKFISAARAAARLKPVVAIKAGRHPEAAKAATTHTGALSSADRVVDAAFRRAGILRIDDVGELFAAAETIGRFAARSRSQVAVITNGGGGGVLLVDQLLDRGHKLAPLSETTLEALNRVLPENWSRANPVDIIGDAPPERYAAAIEKVAADPAVDLIVVMNCPTGLASPKRAAEAVAATAPSGVIEGKPVLGCWLGGRAAREGRSVLAASRIPTYETPAETAAAITYLTDWSGAQRNLIRTPGARGSLKPDRAAARGVFRGATAEGRRMLTETEAKSVLRAYGIPTPETVFVPTPEDAETVATRLLRQSPKVAVKLFSKTLTHKSDVGGIMLGLETPAAARAAAETIAANLDRLGKGDQLDGFTVQEMVERKHPHELILGLTRDQVLGPAILFGSGGVSAEVVDDTAVALPPLDDVLAADVIDRTRIGKLLGGYRDRPPAHRAKIIECLCSLSQLIVDFRCVAALDVNPLLADELGVMALDARIEIDPEHVEDDGPNPTLAIKPVPEGWDRQIELASGARISIRPIIPADAALYPAFLQNTTVHDLRLRFLSPVTVSDEMLIRLTQIDYDREMAFVALEASGALAGIGRLIADPDRERAEFALIVRSDLQGQGLGFSLLSHLRNYASAEGIGVIEGVILEENEKMLELCERQGFRRSSHADEPGSVHVTLTISPEIGS
jgi:acetyltransferase